MNLPFTNPFRFILINFGKMILILSAKIEELNLYIEFSRVINP